MGAFSVRRVTARSLTAAGARAAWCSTERYLHEHYCTHQTPSTKAVFGRCNRSTCCSSHSSSCGGASTHQIRCWAVEVSTDPSAAGKSSRAGLASPVSGSPHSVQNATQAQSAVRADLPRGTEGLKAVSVWCRVRSARKLAESGGTYLPDACPYEHVLRQGTLDVPCCLTWPANHFTLSCCRQAPRA